MCCAKVLRSGATSLEYDRKVQPQPKIGPGARSRPVRAGRLCAEGKVLAQNGKLAAHGHQQAASSTVEMTPP
jgi:hypothetical protein